MSKNHVSFTPVLPPTELLPWLNVEGSLTAVLEAKAGQPLHVKRGFEGYRLLSLTQKKQLGIQGIMISRPMLAWVREVQLYGNDEQPWVKAQSVFPLPSLVGRARRLQQLKGTPIGYVLFKRSRTLPNQRFIQHTSEGWQRQTRYDWYGRSLLISETFLPAFLSHDADKGDITTDAINKV
ncbi:chorismate--pyruvate lyase family protein [Psychrobacter aquaticus]|uniref:Probable chorismate pyruvate-lyase n=1 Tax=Psychrobacter aquaticus CMS 56 TaxID=1354303 RepID=U4T3R3_9GAMM|nr:chorismate lyase [Psychrobacter aquaticus]ERL55465.1 Chorismate--pyruvate lyase [Psychrobacter aquaticus CMS 56]